MKPISPSRRYILPLPAFFFFLNLVFIPDAAAQEKRAVKGEMAICVLNISASVNAQKNASGPRLKSYKPMLNQAGYFDRVTNIQPLQKVTIQTTYPKGHAGEKVAVIVLDGGTLENNEKAKILQLDRKRGIDFTFQTAGDAGIYRILLRKGNDTKVVQLWVGPEPLPVKR